MTPLMIIASLLTGILIVGAATPMRNVFKKSAKANRESSGAASIMVAAMHGNYCCRLYAGRLFYEKQGEGLGEYFFDSIFSDIDSLALFAGIHEKHFGYS